MSGGFLSMTSETLQSVEPEYFKPKTMEPAWKLGEPIDPSTMPPGKTPVSLLTECCTRKSVTPVLQLVGDGGDIGEKPTAGPSFTYMYEVNGMKATGRGKNKKFAKHLAAKRILEMIIKSGHHIDWAIPGRTAEEAITYLNGLMPELNDVQAAGLAEVGADGAGDGAENAGGSTQLDNPVGKVNEKCLRMKLALPQYEVVEEKGQPNDKNFILSCRVGSGLETRGEGRNKKIAKRNAAIEMLKIIDALPSDATLAGGADDALCSTEDELVAGGSIGDGGAARPPSTNGGSPGIKNGMDDYISKQLEALDVQDTDPGPFSKRLLCDVMSEMADLGQHEPVFIHQDRVDTKGQFQCLVQLAVNPIAVCHGTGTSKEMAEYVAAHNALQYLKVMAKAEE